MSGVTPPKGAGLPSSTERGVRDERDSRGPTRNSRSDSPTAADVDRLARLLNDDRSGSEGGHEEHQEERDDRPMTPAEAILAALGGFQAPPPLPTPAMDAATDASEAGGPVRGAELNELAEKVVERMLVGKRDDGEFVLRMTLDNAKFGATEVSIARHQGALELRIDTMSDNMKSLFQVNAADFANDLAKRLAMPVVLEVNAPTRSDQPFGQGQGDNQRSRGYDQIIRYMTEANS